MIGAGKAGELRDVLVTKKRNVAFQDLTFVLFFSWPGEQGRS